MKANKSLVSLAFAFAAGWLFARPVSVQEASYAASAWARAGEALGVALGSEIDSMRIKTFSAANDAKVYAVPFVGGGIVFTTSDTRMEPVIGFSKSSSVDLDDSGALASLLKNDVRLRAKLLEAIEKDRNAQSGNSAAVSATLDDGRWASLLAGFGSSGGASGMTAADSADPLSSISSIRVSPIVKTKWSQQKAGGINCYNYYTPNNYPCGCTATAAAQVMRYFSYPDGEVASRNFICSVDGVDRSLSLMGGLYDWEKMVYAPADGVNEEVAKEIGKLTYDLGVALGSEYADAATGALPYDVAKTFRNVFGYANAYSYWNEDTLSSGKGGLHNLGLRERIIYANLDARKPVQLAIYGYDRLGEWGGHAVVADGYGYHNVDGVETAFVHINMGWGGVDDLWYNIPEIDAANTGSYYASTATTYSYMAGATFNVDAAEAGLEIFSGRVLDAYGEPAANAVVRLQGDNGYSAVATADDKGIYSFAVPGGAKYVATTSTDDGKYVAATDEVLVR